MWMKFCFCQCVSSRKPSLKNWRIPHIRFSRNCSGRAWPENFHVLFTGSDDCIFITARPTIFCSHFELSIKGKNTIDSEVQLFHTEFAGLIFSCYVRENASETNVMSGSKLIHHLVHCVKVARVSPINNNARWSNTHNDIGNNSSDYELLILLLYCRSET